MRLTHVSTAATAQAQRQSMLRGQAELQTLQQELASGRLADAPVTLGRDFSHAVEMRGHAERIEGYLATNGLLNSQLDAGQQALSRMVDLAHTVLGQLLALRDSTNGTGKLAELAKQGLASFTELANTTFKGDAVFGGDNTDQAPLAAFSDSPPSGNRLALTDAFASVFGFDMTDPAAASITPDAMTSFLEDAVDDNFGPVKWNINWSSATDGNSWRAISPDETVEIPANANADAFRDLAAGLSLAATFTEGAIVQPALGTVIGEAASLLGKAIAGLGEEQSRLGIVQQRVSDTSDRLSQQRDLLQRHADGLDGIDITDVSARLNAQMTQLEATYTISARISRLSLIDYL